MGAFLEAAGQADNVELLISRWYTDYDDPDSFAHALFHSEGGVLRRWFTSRRSDGLLEAARALVAEGGIEALQQTVGHGGAGESELGYRRCVGRLEGGVGKQIVIKRRYQIEVGDLLGGDELERAASVETRQADEGAVDQSHGQQRATRHNGRIQRPV